MLLDANCISRCRVTENMGYMQELECRVKGKILPEISGLCSWASWLAIDSLAGDLD